MEYPAGSGSAWPDFFYRLPEMSIRKVQIAQRLVLIAALLVSLYTAKQAWGAQKLPVGDYGRIEQRIEAIDQNQREREREVERRFAELQLKQAVIDSKLDLIIKIGGLLSMALLGQLASSLWGLIVRRPEGSRPRRGDTKE